MAKRLFVGNLPYSTREDDLKEHFSKAGNVEFVKIITDKISSRSKGFGFVEMETDEEAEKAIEMLNNQEFDGRQLIVNEARPLVERS